MIINGQKLLIKIGNRSHARLMTVSISKYALKDEWH